MDANNPQAGVDYDDASTLSGSMNHSGSDGQVDLSNLDDSIEDAIPEFALDNGQYVLTVVDAKIGQSSPQKAPYLRIDMECQDYPGSKLISDFVTLPDRSKLDARQLNRAKLRMAEAEATFGFTYSPSTIADVPGQIIGAQVRAIVNKSNDAKYGDQNRVQQYL